MRPGFRKCLHGRSILPRVERKGLRKSSPACLARVCLWAPTANVGSGESARHAQTNTRARTKTSAGRGHTPSSGFKARLAHEIPTVLVELDHANPWQLSSRDDFERPKQRQRPSNGSHPPCCRLSHTGALAMADRARRKRSIKPTGFFPEIRRAIRETRPGPCWSNSKVSSLERCLDPHAPGVARDGECCAWYRLWRGGGHGR